MPLHDPQQEEQRRRDDDGDERQPPVVDRHRHGGRIIIARSTTHATPPHEKNWLSVSTSEVTRARAAPPLLVWRAIAERGCGRTPAAEVGERLLGPTARRTMSPMASW